MLVDFTDSFPQLRESLRLLIDLSLIPLNLVFYLIFLIVYGRQLISTFPCKLLFKMSKDKCICLNRSHLPSPSLSTSSMSSWI